MTAAQRSRYYFPAWAAAAAAHGWAKRPTPASRQACFASPELNVLYQNIWELANFRAGEAARNLLPDDFRHACHQAAIGQDKSSADLTNDECERIVALFNLLADPSDLRAIMAWNSPNEARRRRMLYWITHNCVESYVVAVCREKFGTDDPAKLHFEHLRQLHMTLKNRRNAKRSARPAPSNQPF